MRNRSFVFINWIVPISQYRRRTAQAMAVLALGLATCLVTSCGASTKSRSTALALSGSTKFLNTHRVELAIDQSVLEQRGLQAHAFCPSRVPQVTGQTFTCIAYAPKVNPATFNVVQIDSSGHVRYSSK
jgi:hypothetical protein